MVFTGKVKFFQCVSLIAFFILTAFSQSFCMSAETRSIFAYIGTYTGGKSKGIYLSRFNSQDGKFSAPELAAETKNPTFLALHPDGRVLYAVGEIGDFQGKRAGALTAFSIEEKT